MTRLRKMMLEELQRCNYAKSTVKAYVRIIQEFARHFHQPPDRLGPQHLRQYQAYLFQEKKLDAGTVQLHVAALRFFYVKTLKRRYLLEDIPRPKRYRKPPTREQLHREEPFLAYVAPPACAPRHRALPHVHAGRPSRSLFPMRSSRHLLQLLP